MWPLWSSLHVICSNPENELAGKAKERHVRKMLLACLLAKQCLCIEDVRHVTRNQPRISKKRHKKKQQRREKFLHVGGNLCALLLTWPLDRHCAIIRRDCSAKRKRKKERECAKEAERSLIYGSEPTHTHTHRCSPAAIGVTLWQQREGMGEKEAAKRDVNGGILMVF